MIKIESNIVPKDFFYDNYNISEFNVKAGNYLEYAMKIDSKLKAKHYLKFLASMLRKEIPKDGLIDKTSDEDLEKILKSRIAYYAGYYDDVIRYRVEDFYETEHPIFGKIIEHGSPSPDEVEECAANQCDLVTLRTAKAKIILEKTKLELEALRKSNAMVWEMYGSELSAQSLIEQEKKLEEIINKYQRYFVNDKQFNDMRETSQLVESSIFAHGWQYPSKKIKDADKKFNGDLKDFFNI